MHHMSAWLRGEPFKDVRADHLVTPDLATSLRTSKPGVKVHAELFFLTFAKETLSWLGHRRNREALRQKWRIVFVAPGAWDAHHGRPLAESTRHLADSVAALRTWAGAGSSTVVLLRTTPALHAAFPDSNAWLRQWEQSVASVAERFHVPVLDGYAWTVDPARNYSRNACNPTDLNGDKTYCQIHWPSSTPWDGPGPGLVFQQLLNAVDWIARGHTVRDLQTAKRRERQRS